MREVVFVVTHEPGVNPVADLLADHPAARLRSAACHVTESSLWRVDHAQGPAVVLDSLADMAGARYFTDCLVRDGCAGDWETTVLDRTDSSLVLYSYWERAPDCDSVPHLAREHFGEGVVIDETWRERSQRWRVLAPDGDISPFIEDVRAVADADVTFERVSDPDPAADDALPPEQADALAAAVEAGYYETPRETEAYDLADDLGIPGSTLTYRLRRAEAWLAKEYVDR
ncbi:HTH-10 family transcription regulator [Natronomonas pharaonis DSM 2160]|uniref:HTH-10 family transcription regulator n=1 Tax=Natronomonas pharaonis (strain ATCC 35678 / DSM 2160 / CIP 103997 / JCM 8858 / NBRC 14720 / NCIMB 2260 / Gabara) TaxID=348780 RepID=A0A1U7EZL0_NATPD|nr:helix-turn-helix domain-containing protein [Natronomonas pharaonis]CAI50740.1 HTH-10 family transcription regulator [Natronomonas pharaonis DSM 2160]